jgi:photosystem II stability/assembly factor-like uncharacterized protein
MYSIILSIVIIAQPLPYFQPKLLVSFEKSDVNQLSAIEISILEDLGQIVLSEIASNQLENLKNTRVKYQILDHMMPFDEYWLVKIRNQDFHKIKSYGKIVAQYGSTVIVKGNRTRIWQLSQLGFELKRLNRKPVSLIPKKDTGFKSAMPQDTFIQRVLSNVSADTIHSFVQDLQDFGTRYSPTSGCSAAAEYIYQLFDRYGLNPQFDCYFMPSDVYDVKFIYPKAWLVDDKGSAFMSPNCGDTWIESHHGNTSLLGTDFTDTLNGWFSGGDGNVLTTRDGGLTWDTIAQQVADFLFRIDFVDTAIGWAGGGIGDSAVLLKTTDRGRNWTTKSVFPGNLYGIYAYDSQKCWAAGLDINNNGLILQTTDGGNSWNIQFTSPNYLLAGVAFTDSLKGWVVGGNLSSSSAAIYHTTNGGDTWIRQTTSGYFLFDIDFIDSLTGFACGYATITRTTNGGGTWSRRNVEPMLYGIDFTDANYGIAVGSAGTALVTTNNGNTWRTTYTHNNYTWRNVVGTKTGTTNPDEIYIICGHFDATSENPYLDAPGADDNGSGTAAALEAARILNPYPFGATIKFIGFSGEEQGLLGSAVYAESASVHGLDIRGVLNLDMIGYLDDPNFDFNITSNNNSESLADLFVNACTTYTSLTPYKIIDPGAVYSDHASFWTYGYRALEGIERDGTQWNPYYHTTGDTLGAGLNSIPFATEVIKGSIACLAHLARPYGIIGIAESNLSNKLGSISLNCIPNPMSKNGNIKWQVRTACPVNLKLYSSSGRLVKTLFDSKGQDLNPGLYQISWDGKDNNNLNLPSGIYFVKIKAKNNQYNTKIVYQNDASKKSY